MKTINQNLPYLAEVNEIYAHHFLKECERLSIKEPWLKDKELEDKAHDVVMNYFYYLEKSRLPYYRSIITKIGWTK